MDVRTYATIMASAGAIVHNFQPTETDLEKGRGYWSAQTARYAAWKAEKAAVLASEAAHTETLIEHIEGLPKKVQEELDSVR